MYVVVICGLRALHASLRVSSEMWKMAECESVVLACHRSQSIDGVLCGVRILNAIHAAARSLYVIATLPTSFMKRNTLLPYCIGAVTLIEAFSSLICKCCTHSLNFCFI